MSNVLTDEPKKEDFLAEVEVMDLSPIREKQFLVAVGTGTPEQVKFLCSTIHGPFTFPDMCQEVGEMWKEHQHHAKVILCSTDSSKAVEILNENTLDYIECHFENIIMEEMLQGAFDEEKKYTCRAGTSNYTDQPDPRHEKKEAAPAAAEEDDDL